VSDLPIPSADIHAPALASRGKIIMMAIIAGAVITNIYCTQPIVPLIASGLRVDVATVDLVAGAALFGFASGLALLLPLGDRFDRRKLVLGQIALAFGFALAAALAPGIWALIAALALSVACLSNSCPSRLSCRCLASGGGMWGLWLVGSWLGF
jgi:predicted MFS family arabinose efflux permease